MPDVVRRGAPSAAFQQLGRYRLIETLGRGGMGTIHLAVAGGLGSFRKLVVLKVLREELTLDDKFVEMFMREAALAAVLNHPNVVHTVEASCEGGRYFLVMEFLDGQPFSEILRRGHQDPVPPLALRLAVICEALAGLHYAHELRDYDGRALHLVHRDVSPPNVFVTYDGQVKLLDFGIAKARDEEGSRPGEFKGKIGYAAPEQLRSQPADRRVDVFSAGVVLWEAIALRHLTHGKTQRQTFEARLFGTEPRIGQVVDVDPKLAAICDRAMSHDPEQRFASAEAFRLALQGYLMDRLGGYTTAAIREYMRTKFVVSRAAMHRLIDAHLRDGTLTDSLVTTLSPARADEAESARADVEFARQLVRAGEEVPTPAPLRRAGRRVVRWFALAGVAALAVAIGSWLAPRRGDRATPAPAATTTRAGSSADPARPPPAVDFAAGTTPAVHEQEASGSGSSTPKADEPHADTRRGDPSQAVEARAGTGEGSDIEARTAARERNDVEARTDARERNDGNAVEVAGEPGSLAEPGASAAAHVAPALRAPAQPAKPAGAQVVRAPAERQGLAAVRARDARGDSAQKALRGPALTGRPAAPADAGDQELDLRSVPRRERRRLDLDNPFR